MNMNENEMAEGALREIGDAASGRGKIINISSQAGVMARSSVLAPFAACSIESRPCHRRMA